MPRLFLAATAFALMALPATAQEAPDPIEKIDLAAMALMPLPQFEGVSNAFALGRFDREGLYAAKGRMAEGAIFPPHSHPDIRLTVVTEGTMYLGMGETYDAGALVAYPVGTVAVTPAGTPHFMAAPDGDVTVLEIGAGPSGATFYGGK